MSNNNILKILHSRLCYLLLIYYLALHITKVFSIDDNSFRKGLTIAEFNTILSSDITDEYSYHDGHRRLSDDEINERWYMATANEWRRARTAEQSERSSLHRHRDHRRQQHRNLRYDDAIENVYGGNHAKKKNETTSYPFIVCDMTYQKPGCESRRRVEDYFGQRDMSVLYNRDDKSCYLVSSLASLAETSPGDFVIHPLIPSMKIRYGAKQLVRESVDGSTRLKAELCPGYVGNKTLSEYLMDDIFSPLERIQGDFERSRSYSRRSGDFGESTSSEDTTDMLSSYKSGNISNIPLTEVPETFSRNEGNYDDDNDNVRQFQRSKLNINSSSNNNDNVGNDTNTILFDKDGEDKNEGNRHCDKWISSHLKRTISYDGETVIFETNEANDVNNDFFVKCFLYLIDFLSRQSSVCSIAALPPYKLFNTEAQWIVQSGRKGYRPFFDAGLTGKGQVVACSDTGIDIDHCYLRDPSLRWMMWGIGPDHRKIVSYADYGDDSDYYAGHGTHVVGTIAGRKYHSGRERDGLVDGIARDAKISFFDIHKVGRRSLSIPEHDFPGLFDVGLNSGAKIHSVSWGDDGNDYGSAAKEFDRYMYRNPDYLIVVAGGNMGRTYWEYDIPNSVSSPGTAKNVITVGASQSEGDDLLWDMLGKDYLADFSARGPTADGRTKPDIIAPGHSITSAKARPDEIGECDESDGILAMAGTSMAAPVVSGTAALVRQYFEDGWYPTGRANAEHAMSPSAALVKAVLLNGAQYLKGIQNGIEHITETVPYDNNQNFGRVSLIDSLPLVSINNLSLFVVDRKGISTGDVDVYRFGIDLSSCKSYDFSVTLAWTDPPASPGCRQCVLNDLDLEVIVNGSGNVVYPNGRNRRDRVNNVERVRLDAKDGNEYVVKVKGYDLVTKSQEYALAVAGCLAIESEEEGSKSEETGDGKEEGTVTAEIDGLNPVESVPSPTLSSVVTISDSEYKYYGNVFDVVAQRDITILGMDVHAEKPSATNSSSDEVTIEIWTKPDTYQGFTRQSSSWTKILTTTINANDNDGNGLSSLPFFSVPIKLQQGQVRAFYVVSDKQCLFISKGTRGQGQYSRVGDVTVGNEDVEILTGAAASYGFGRTFNGWSWEGRLYYYHSMTD